MDPRTKSLIHLPVLQQQRVHARVTTSLEADILEQLEVEDATPASTSTSESSDLTNQGDTNSHKPAGITILSTLLSNFTTAQASSISTNPNEEVQAELKRYINYTGCEVDANPLHW